MREREIHLRESEREREIHLREREMLTLLVYVSKFLDVDPSYKGLTFVTTLQEIIRFMEHYACLYSGNIEYY